MKNNGAGRNDDVLIAAASKKNNLKRLLAVSVSFVLVLCLVSFFLVSTKTPYHDRQASVLSERKKQQKDEAVSNQSSISIDSLIISFQKHLKPQLETIANSGTLYGTENIFSKEADDLLSRFNNMVVRQEKLKEPPDTTNLQSTMEQADALINKFDSTFDKHLNRINESFLEKDNQKFRRNLDSALLLAPFDNRLVKWNDLAPVVEVLFRQFQIAETAEVEKNYSVALAALKKIKELGHSNENLENNMTRLSSIIAQKNHDDLVLEARKNLDKGNFSTALRNIDAAQKIFPKKNNLDSIKLEIEEKKKIELAMNWKEKADRKAAVDNWLDAFSYFNKAIQLTPGNKNLIEGKELASKIIQYTNILLQLKETPLRLTDANVSNYAKDILKESSSIEMHSASLSSLRSEVALIMDEVLRPRDVVINSDGKTRIEVKGVGFVEPTIEKTIQLRPGKYIVHAACPGHKTSLLTLEVPATDLIKAKRIVCGKRI
ncbi:MAG: hypothetical protein VX986_06725 [Pseudomonadota bacterium]|nr:hypothetical protein [Pseudomonadota bacterium]